MSVVRERENTRRTIWIVSGFVVALAIAITAYLFARRTDTGAAPPSAVATDSETDGASKTAAAPVAAQPVVQERAPPAPAVATQVATAKTVESAPDPIATDAAPSDTSAPKLSAEEQSLADAVGDTRRAAPLAATAAAASVTAAVPN